MNPKQLARIGLIYLEEAVLDVLSHEAAKPEKISKSIGIPSLKDKRHNTRYSIVFGILLKLKKEGRVERCDDARWKLIERSNEN